jgi:thiaminase
MTAFADQLVEANRDVRAAMAGHPLVLGLADGILPDGALQAWVQQDRILVVAVAGRSPADSAYHAWIQNWSGEGFRAFVGVLGRGLDERAGAPSPALAQRLGELFARAARFELAFREMCWSGQAWPG